MKFLNILTPISRAFASKSGPAVSRNLESHLTSDLTAQDLLPSTGSTHPKSIWQVENAAAPSSLSPSSYDAFPQPAAQLSSTTVTGSPPPALTDLDAAFDASSTALDIISPAAETTTQQDTERRAANTGTAAIPENNAPSRHDDDIAVQPQAVPPSICNTVGTPTDDAIGKNGTESGEIHGMWKVKRVVAEGGYAVVKLVVNSKNGQLAALKTMKREGSRPYPKFVYKELQLLALLHHPHIIDLHDVFSSSGSIHFVLPWMEQGDLVDYVAERGIDTGAGLILDEEDARKIWRQLLSAVGYLHSHSIVHRDIKPENILMDANGDIHLTDFTFADIVWPGRRVDTFCGTVGYVAPEILEGFPYVGPEVDVFSMGITLHWMLSGRLPFHGSDLHQLLKVMRRGRKESDLNGIISLRPANLIARSIEYDSRLRADLLFLLLHSWTNEGYGAPPDLYVDSRPHDIPQPDPHILQHLANVGIPAPVTTNTLHNHTNDINKPVTALYNLAMRARKRGGLASRDPLVRVMGSPYSWWRRHGRDEHQRRLRGVFRVPKEPPQVPRRVIFRPTLLDRIKARTRPIPRAMWKSMKGIAKKGMARQEVISDDSLEVAPRRPGVYTTTPGRPLPSSADNDPIAAETGELTRTRSEQAFADLMTAAFPDLSRREIFDVLDAGGSEAELEAAASSKASGGDPSHPPSPPPVAPSQETPAPPPASPKPAMWRRVKKRVFRFLRR
ncbi:NUAK SNF1-like kinase 2 [Borealophlyctis nickersoniae]|nr:NUAK SNF1-like kinase 2 [Borealophlyctis nickersoniae]